MSTRRGFLWGVGAGAPLLLGMTNKSGSAKPVLGSGEYTYEAFHDWGDLPPQIKYGNTHGVCEDSQGHIYIHHTVNAASESSDSMVIFDANGRFVKSWGKQFKGGAHGLHIRREGSTEFLYLCDTQRGLVVKTTLDGEEVFTIGYPDQSDAYKPNPDGSKKKYSPTNLAIAPNGDIYVGDGYGSSFVNVYDSNGKYLRTFGGPGKEPGQLNCPHGIILDDRGTTPIMMIADRANNRIQTFTLAGEPIAFLGGVNLPCYFDFGKRGETVVPDLGARVTLLDRNNKVIEHLGDDSAANNWQQVRKLDRSAFRPGKFVCPHGACFDHNGNIFVVEWVEVGRVTKLRKV
jgi:DNA-binding beta-propeller fold protein YncE